MLDRTHKHNLVTPPKGAIAHHLIRAWVEATTTEPMTAMAVIDPKTARAQNANLIYQINYCRNGDFPAGSNP